MILRTVEDAINNLLNACPTPILTTLPLHQALHHTLAKPIHTPYPIPHFTKAPYDGFAFYCSVENAKGLRFRVIGRIGAGEIYPHTLLPGEALRIMTGAPFPEGADTLAMFEQCAEETTSEGTYITVKGHLPKGGNRIKIGEECPALTEVLHRGQRITPGVIAVLAGLGIADVPVYKLPKVALLTSGKEVVEPGQPLTACTVYNSNGPMLQALLSEMGCSPYFVRHITDTPDALSEQIEKLRPHLAVADIIISTGGVSVGDFDTLPKIYAALGATPLFTKIAMRPGAAQYAGIGHIPVATRAQSDDWHQRNNSTPTIDSDMSISPNASHQTVFIGLSGNPSAAFNGFHLLAKPALAALAGQPYKKPLQTTCILKRSLTKKNPVDRYIQGELHQVDNTLYFDPVEHFTSNALIGLGRAQALFCMARSVADVAAGETITVQII